MSATLPLVLPHLPSHRPGLEEFLSSAAAHSDAGHQCALTSCGFRGQQLVAVRRLGRQELHQEWDLKEEVRRLGRQELHREWDLREEVGPGCCGEGKCNLQ